MGFAKIMVLCMDRAEGVFEKGEEYAKRLFCGVYFERI